MMCMPLFFFGGEQMQKVMFYDKARLLAEQIKNMEFWTMHQEFMLLDTARTEEELVRFLWREHPDVLLLVKEPGADGFWGHIHRMKDLFHGIRLIVVGCERSYESVREAFLSGVFDYLVQPLKEEELEQTFLRIYDVLGLSYTVNYLYMKMDALVDSLLTGGDQGGSVIRSMVRQIYKDWEQDEIHCQMVADKTKYRMYEKLVSGRPWLEKLLCREEFTSHGMVSPKNMEDVITDWEGCFQRVKVLLDKYRLMEDRQIGRIASWVMEHVDEKVTLENVAAGVYMNPTYVSHIFKKVSGINLADYIVNVKTDRAKVLLQNQDSKAADVAAAVGYSSAEYFSRIFRKKTGVTPAVWQKDRNSLQKN